MSKYKRWIAAALCILSLTGGMALAEWSAPNANLSKYEADYGEAAEGYKTIKYGAQSQRVAQIKEQLTGLGFFANRAGDTYHRTLETAIRVFAAQTRIGGDGSEITPLMQAMLADTANMPKAISPAIDVSAYSSEENATTFTAYTFARVNRTSSEKDVQVGFSGRILSAEESAGTYYYVVEMESDATKLVYVSYQPLPRTTVFQTGDTISVFGVTQGKQTLPYAGMSETALLVKADRVGYASK